MLKQIFRDRTFLVWIVCTIMNLVFMFIGLNNYANLNEHFAAGCFISWMIHVFAVMLFDKGE